MKGKKAFRMVGRWGLVFFLFLGLLLPPGLAQANPKATKSAAATQTQSCTLLTREEVLEGLKASEAKYPGKLPTIRVEKIEEDPSYNEFVGYRVCFYFYSLEWTKGDKWDYLIRVSYDRGPGALQELKEVKGGKIMGNEYRVERIAGLGEEAYWVHNFRLYVWYRGGLLKIDHGTRSFPKDVSVQLAKSALGRIR